MDMPIELDVDDELEEALEAAPERDLVDLAGTFFFHTFVFKRRFDQRPSHHKYAPL